MSAVTWGDVIKTGLDAFFIWMGVLALRAKTAAVASDVKNNTSSPEQVARLEKKVEELTKDVAAVKFAVTLMAPKDDRGPEKP